MADTVFAIDGSSASVMTSVILAEPGRRKETMPSSTVATDMSEDDQA